MLDSDLPSASFFSPLIWNFHSIFHVEIPFLTKSVRPARCMEGKTCFLHMYTNTAPYYVTHTESPQGFYSPVLLPGTLHTYSWDREWSSQALYSWSPALGCWQQVRVEGLLFFGSSEVDDCWSPFQLHTVSVIYYTIPKPCVIPRIGSSAVPLPSQSVPLRKGQCPTSFHIFKPKYQTSALPSNLLKELQTPQQLEAATTGQPLWFPPCWRMLKSL